jgi:hypothetical protein
MQLRVKVKLTQLSKPHGTSRMFTCIRLGTCVNILVIDVILLGRQVPATGLASELPHPHMRTFNVAL